MKKLIFIGLFLLMVLSVMAQPFPPMTRSAFTTNSAVVTNGIVKNLSAYAADSALIVPATDVHAQGAVQNGRLPFVTGSAASLYDQQMRGNEVWANQKMPIMVISSRGGSFVTSNNLQVCTELNMRQSIAAFRSNGVLSFMTNSGINVIYDAENGWLTNHRSASGKLQWMTNRWPLATIDATNVSWYLRTNNVGLGLMLYADPIVPTNGNTEIDLNPISGSAYWHYPNGVNPLGAVEIQPLIDGLHFHSDLTEFYREDVDMLTIQDGGDYYYLPGYQNGVWDQLAYSMLYPTYFAFAQDRYYPTLYSTRRKNNGIILNALISLPQSNAWPSSVEYQLNGVCFGSGAQTTEPGNSGVSASISNIRPEIINTSRWLPKTTHQIMQSDNIAIMEIFSHADWKSHLSIVALFQTDLWLTYPHYIYCPLPSFSSQVTNSGFMSIWQDPERNRPYIINFGATNFIFGKQLTQPNKVAVLFGNMSQAVSTNLTVYWTNLTSGNFPMGRPAFATEVWTNTSLGICTNSITVTVQPTNVYLLTLEFALDNLIVSGITFSNGATMSPNANSDVTQIRVSGNSSAFSINKNGEIGMNITPVANMTLELENISGQQYALEFSQLFKMGRNSGDGFFYMYGNQANANGVIITGVDGESARFLPTATSVSTVSNLAINNITVLKTNAAPSNVTLGVTAPDRWILITNNALRYYMPVWTNH